ncbi:sulfite reductase subunit alpha [Spartobacteria bacterium LR76]|nr:sulfite reductase subunit alpha [Spartobacteria bacterium LR76]
MRGNLPIYSTPMSTESASGYSRKNPFPAKLTVNQRLTAEGSNKDTRHFEISLEGSGLTYEVGDSLGVFATNDPELVELILANQGFSGDEPVTNPDGQTVTIRQALTKDYVITEPAKQILQAVPLKDESAAFLNDLLDPGQKASLDDYLWGRDILDVLEEFPAAKFTPEEFVKVLRKLQPRLYSIASSQKAVGEAVHLTVAVVRYNSKASDRLRKGVCSTFLAERSEAGLPVFTHTAKHFRVPEDLNAPVIMVGPGTGIAPFRAFLQERAATGATGKNWLFFGEQHAATDFFYREEFEKYQESGVLTKLTTAFSRDQAEKIYVQHRLVENATEIYEWLEAGGYFYVCGDAKNMAKDVEAALHTIVEKAGGKTPEQAKEYIEEFKKAKRYRKDVY